MEIKESIAKLEAILFAHGEPIAKSRLSEALEIDEDTVDRLFVMLRDKLEENESAVKVIRIDDKYQMVTRDEYADVIRRTMDIRKNTPLSQAAMEVLAVIAYNQPVTKGFVEQVRGVDCSGVVNSLVTKGLVEEKGRLELPGRPLLYGTTDTFLRCFKLSTLEELPPVPGHGEIGEDRKIEEFIKKSE